MATFRIDDNDIDGDIAQYRRGTAEEESLEGIFRNVTNVRKFSTQQNLPDIYMLIFLSRRRLSVFTRLWRKVFLRGELNKTSWKPLD